MSVSSCGSMNSKSFSNINFGDLENFVPSDSLEKRDLLVRLESLMEWRLQKGPIQFSPYERPQDLGMPNKDDRTVIKVVGFQPKKTVCHKTVCSELSPLDCSIQTSSSFSLITQEAKRGLEALERICQKELQEAFERICQKKLKEAFESPKTIKRDTSAAEDPLMLVFQEERMPPNFKSRFGEFFSKSSTRSENCPVVEAKTCTSVIKGFKKSK